MAYSAGDIVSEVVATLHGYGLVQDRVAALSDALTASATSFTVDATSGQAVGISPGVVQIDSELLYVSSVVAVGGACTLTTFGRGYQGTTAAAHAAATAVISQPPFPRGRMFNLVNEVIGSLYPALFQVGQDNTKTVTAAGSYSLDVDLRWVIAAEWQDATTATRWHPIRGWRVEQYDRSVVVTDCLPVGTPLRFTYALRPAQFTSESDDLVTVTGLPVTVKELLVLGAAAKAAPALDIAHIQQVTLDQFQNTSTSMSSGTAVSKYLYALFQTRLGQESTALRRRYPAHVRRGR